MRASELLKHAAKRIEDLQEDYACIAIGQAAAEIAYKKSSAPTGDEKVWKAAERARLKFVELYRPKNPTAVWFGRAYDPANRNQRVLALCFTAAILESEGD